MADKEQGSRGETSGDNVAEDRQATPEELNQAQAAGKIYDYDLMETFEREIKPHMDRMKALLKRYQIPYLMLFQTSYEYVEEENSFAVTAGTISSFNGFMPARQMDNDIEIIMALIYTLVHNDGLPEELRQLIKPIHFPGLGKAGEKG